MCDCIKKSKRHRREKHRAENQRISNEKTKKEFEIWLNNAGNESVAINIRNSVKDSTSANNSPGRGCDTYLSE